jgi:post-segregation antitoxin (ccd killing protein)
MGTKKKVLLYIDAETIQKAKELGLNLSKVSENALKEAVCRLEGTKSETDCQDGTHCDERGRWCGGWDLNSFTRGDVTRKSLFFLCLHQD